MHEELRTMIVKAFQKNYMEEMADVQLLDDILKAVEDAGYSQCQRL